MADAADELAMTTRSLGDPDWSRDVNTPPTNPPTSTSRLLALACRLERDEALDPVVDTIRGALPAALAHGRLRRLLGGSWLGHSAHPMMTDLPIGAWTSAMLLDLAGGPAARPFATGFVGVGLAAAVPTALTGASDWLVADRESQRVGSVHVAANTVALTLYTASLVARLRRRHLTGVALGLAGGAAASVGGYLGGHLVTMRSTAHDASEQAMAESAAHRAEIDLRDAPLSDGHPSGAMADPTAAPLVADEPVD